MTDLAGNRWRYKAAARWNDGIGNDAHVMKPTFGVNAVNGKFIFFLESGSCGRRLNVRNKKLRTVIGKLLSVKNYIEFHISVVLPKDKQYEIKLYYESR